jgi:hypothetical protein
VPANDFPIVINGQPVDADLWFNQLAQWVTLLKTSLRFVAELTDTTSNNNTGGAEAISSSITFTAVAGVRYKVTYMGVSESTIQYDIATVQLRWENNTVAALTGASFATDNKTAIQASKGDGFTLVGTFGGQAGGPLTITATIKRINGTGQVKQNAASAGQSLYWLVECYGGTP